MELVPCSLDDARLDPLLQDYIREWSALLPISAGPDGRFSYELKHAIEATLFCDGERALGFAFTMRDENRMSHVEEFFVVPAVRRRGFATAAAHALCARTPGPWTWTVRPENPAGLAFWRRAFPEAATAPETGEDGVVRTRFTRVVR